MLCADVTSRIVGESDGPDFPLDVYSFWFAYRTAAGPQPSAPPHPQHYGVGRGASPSPPPGYTQDSGYGMAGAPPPTFNEPPPTYSEATGWD